MTTDPRSRANTRADEMVSLAERMGYLHALRAAFVCITLASPLFTPSLVGASQSHLALASAAYLIAAAASEGFRRARRARGLSAVAFMLLLDGIYLAWAIYLTGSTHSQLRFLPYVHLTAVTLLASYRTGLKIALWHSLLFFVVFYAQAGGILEAVGGFSETDFRRLWINVVALGLVTASTTLFSSLNERELRQRRRDLEGLARMAADLENVSRPDEVAHTMLDYVCDYFGFKRGAVLSVSDSRATLLAYRGPGDRPETTGGVDAVVTDALADGKVILRRQLDGEQNRDLSLMLPLAHNLAIVPLHAEGGPLGVMVLEYGAKRGRIERRVVLMVQQLAAHGALALRNAFLLQQVQRLAETDPLTGIANRRTFHGVLERELARAARSGDQVTLVMIDIDHFKKLNDAHGHQIGDDVLKGVAHALPSACRSFDTPARYGGEEFAVILPACTSKESLIAAERLRSAIAGARVEIPVTASAGVATFPTHAADPNALIKAADEALYESKRAGRDRVTRSRRRNSTRRSAQPTYI
ncbi:MAG: GGDEF domain-containing protein [Actinomycetota bacterium]